MATTSIAGYVALVVGALGAPAHHGRTVAATLRALPDRPGTVELEVRNISPQALDALVLAMLSVTPAWGNEPPRHHWSIATSVDPTTGRFDGLYAERPSPRLRLPLRGSTRVRIDLESLKWSLTPQISVWTPRDLWELAEPGDYDVVVFIHVLLSLNERQVEADSAWSAPARVRVVRR